MVFKNISVVFSFCFYFFDLVFSSFCRIQYALLNVLFWFSAFRIVLNVLVQQVNVTEVEVSVKIEQQQRIISHDRASLTHYSRVLLFYTP